MNSKASKAQVFLDTSIQIERFISLNSRRVEIEEELANCEIEFVTSHYVWMEFQRSLLANYIHVYNQVTQSNDWETIAYHLRSGQRAYRPRSLGQCFQILTSVIDKSERNRDRALNFLSVHIRQELPRRFWRHITPLADPILCDLVVAGVSRQEDGLFTVADSCRKDMATCHLPEFLHEHKVKLQAVADYLDAHPHVIKDQSRLERLLTAILADPRAVLGQSACWPLGDLIIILQVPSNACVWSLDKDFVILADILDIKRYPDIQ